jgi:hypothetical protein
MDSPIIEEKKDQKIKSQPSAISPWVLFPFGIFGLFLSFLLLQLASLAPGFNILHFIAFPILVSSIGFLVGSGKFIILGLLGLFILLSLLQFIYLNLF